MADEKLEFTGIESIKDHFEKTGKSAEEIVRNYRSQVFEFTGHDPSKPVTPLDVVWIVDKVFGRFLHGGAGSSGDCAAADSPSPAGGAAEGLENPA